jgi:hypothetical protein
MQDVAYGAGSVLSTAVYALFKATFCILGGITPGVVRGQERVKFIGGQAPPPPARPPASK